jgi:restriction endonuclease S subunit
MRNLRREINLQFFCVRKNKNNKVMLLGDVLERNKNGKTNSNDITNSGEYPFYSATSNNPSGTHNKFDFDGKEYLLFAKSGGNSKKIFGNNLGIGKFWYVQGKSAGNVAIYQFMMNTEVRNKIYLKYLNLSLKNILFKIQKLAKYATGNGNVDMNALQNIKISVPSIERQKEIVKFCEHNELLIKQLEQNIEENKKLSKMLLDDLVENKKNVINDNLEIKKETNKIDDSDNLKDETKNNEEKDT